VLTSSYVVYQWFEIGFREGFSGVLRNVDENLGKPLYHHHHHRHRLYNSVRVLASVKVTSIPEAFFGFHNENFYGVRLSASRPTPNLEDQGTPFSLGHHL
jgi:hypothetical protein